MYSNKKYSYKGKETVNAVWTVDYKKLPDIFSSKKSYSLKEQYANLLFGKSYQDISKYII